MCQICVVGSLVAAIHVLVVINCNTKFMANQTPFCIVSCHIVDYLAKAAILLSSPTKALLKLLRSMHTVSYVYSPFSSRDNLSQAYASYCTTHSDFHENVFYSYGVMRHCFIQKVTFPGLVVWEIITDQKFTF